MWYMLRLGGCTWRGLVLWGFSIGNGAVGKWQVPAGITVLRIATFVIKCCTLAVIFTREDCVMCNCSLIFEFIFIVCSTGSWCYYVTTMCRFPPVNFTETTFWTTKQNMKRGTIILLNIIGLWKIFQMDLIGCYYLRAVKFIFIDRLKLTKIYSKQPS